jgi:hypothetical protein
MGEGFSQKRATAWGDDIDNAKNKSLYASFIKEEKDEFGIKHYIPPRGELARLPIQKIAFAKQKKISFIDEHIKMKTIVPPPDKYGKNT